MGNKKAVCKSMFRAEKPGYLNFNIDKNYAVLNIENNQLKDY